MIHLATHTRDTLLAVLAELLFVVLPLIVLALVLLTWRGASAREIAASAEWSLATAILFGQGVVKFVAGMPGNRGLVPERLAATVAAVIVFGLVPSLVILAMVLIREPSSGPLVWLQMGLFLLSLPVYVVLVGLGHHWSKSAYSAGTLPDA